MINVNAQAPLVRLLIDAALCERVKDYDEDRYQVFRDAVRFAEDAIAGRLAKAEELPKFLVTYEDLELVVVFCRVRERFVVRACFECDDRTPPPGAAQQPFATPVETILEAIGVDSADPRHAPSAQHGGESGVGNWPDVGGPSSMIRMAPDTASFSALIALGRLGLSGEVVRIVHEPPHDAEPHCVPATAQGHTPMTVAPTAAVADADSPGPAPSGVRAPGTSTDP